MPFPADPTHQDMPVEPGRISPMAPAGESVKRSLPHQPTAYPGAGSARSSPKFPSADAVIDALPRVDHREARSRLD